MELPAAEAVERYHAAFQSTRELMIAKNHDYGEAWRDMRVSSLTDLILMKVLRVKQIEDHDGVTKVSEGVEANYQDMANYAAFRADFARINGRIGGNFAVRINFE